jgi:catechol-2,3-dioxygenase
MPRGALHHIALSLPHAEQAAVMAWYYAKGLTYSVQEFPWIGWRGIFTTDPEGNTVELVAFDSALRA